MAIIYVCSEAKPSKNLRCALTPNPERYAATLQVDCLEEKAPKALNVKEVRAREHEDEFRHRGLFPVLAEPHVCQSCPEEVATEKPTDGVVKQPEIRKAMASLLARRSRISRRLCLDR